jgi:hypothetical protein
VCVQVKADDLAGLEDHEVLVYEGVFAWCQAACRTCGDVTPSREALREKAGDLLRYVRWPLISRRQRSNFVGADTASSPSLATDKDIQEFMKSASYRPRQALDDVKKASGVAVVSCRGDNYPKLESKLASWFILFLLLVCILAIIIAAAIAVARESYGGSLGINYGGRGN